MKITSLLLMFLLYLSSCSNVKKSDVSILFYHWKANATYSTTINNALDLAKSKTVFLHFFDIKTSEGGVVEPVYIINKIDNEFKELNIIPVIFISNNIFKREIDLVKLSENIDKLIVEIGNQKLDNKFTEIQLDCDWNLTTKNKYFSLINLLNERYSINATIRLHQIKYQDKTGVPPCDKGTLMVYNIGDLHNENQNSLLQSNIVKQYIYENTSYPLELEIALPLYSQTVILNKEGNIRLVNYSKKKELLLDKINFRQIGDNLFKVTSDILFEGFYLNDTYRIKTEEVTPKEIVESFKIISKSKIDISGVVFYHLDDKTLNSIDLKNILNKL